MLLRIGALLKGSVGSKRVLLTVVASLGLVVCSRALLSVTQL